MNKVLPEEVGFQRYKTALLEIIKNVLPGCKVYMFGSRARNEHDVGADIDLALDCGREIAREKLIEIKDKIEDSTIPLCVDLVDLFSASKELKSEVAAEGVLWEN